MASTYSTNLALELIGTGDQAGTWGNSTNNNIGTLLEQAVSGYATQTITDGVDTVITIPNGATGVARNMSIVCTGTLTASRNLVVPANKKLYVITNNTSGGFAVTVKVSGQTGVSVPNGAKTLLVCNGTDIIDATNYLSSLTLGTPLSVASGGLGLSTPGTAGYYLTSTGTSLTYTAPPATFLSGMIILWSGSSGSIPSGWLLCNGSAGTPNLQDRFVIGAGNTYAVGAVGGTADSVLLQHNHAVTDPGHAHTFSAVQLGSGFNVNANPGVTLNTQAGSTNTATTGISTQTAGTAASGTGLNLPPYYALCYIMKQ